ncbi:hypothetical protein [Pseudoteredinibacter isoporae]|uniref:Uncharacterized protein n=1 Tax=Pseudoteredinibacter isoporae TaxID=570281 RepID=A0A7X0JRG4_9GAMM|nr:hypothetical protein [Pseudoteredinibacter isoporae]MBB6520015.1 hypothetical protein [Pseudoteredinibacter isoporae]NHO85587.1 hypothetical protein [Pseudoteredinibacter isoporae]NIB25961.1 hypothetical protein [Pseudoteredinibacter isoporae]
MTKIKCDEVSYRKGFVEISGNIHENHINLEVWGVHPDFDIPPGEASFNKTPEESFIGNVELELSVENANALIQELSNFVNSLEKDL